MSRHLRLLALVPLAFALTGCAHLYHAENDKAAQEAKKSFDEANITAALDVERVSLLAQQAERQRLVERNDMAMRDVSVANMLKEANNSAVARQLDEAIQRRIKKIFGDAEPIVPAGCEPAYKDAKRRLDFARVARDIAADDAVIAGAKPKPAWKCTAPAAATPPEIASNPVLAMLRTDYDKKCAAVDKAAVCMGAFLNGSAGELAQVDADLNAIASEKERIQKHVAESETQYETTLAQAAAAAQATPGAAKAAAEDVKKALDKIAATPVIRGVTDNPALPHYADLAKVAVLNKKKELLESYLASLGGTKAANPSLPQYRVELVANVVNSATEREAAPTAGFIMEAEYYRLQIAAVRARIARADDAARLYQRKHDLLMYELGELREAQGFLKNAHCVAPATSQRGGGASASEACKQHLARALRAFATSWTAGRMPAEKVSYQLIDLDETAALDESQIALQQTDAAVKAALVQLAKLHAAGVRPEQISNFWQAAGLTAIALRVK